MVFFFLFVEFLLPIFVDLFSTDNVYMRTNEDRESFPLGSLVFAFLNVYLLYNSYALRKNATSQVDNLYWILGIFCTFISFADIPFLVVGRTSMYFYPFLVSLYVKSLHESPFSIRNKNLVVTFLIFFLWFVAYNFMRPEWFNLYPYSFMDITEIFTGYEVR